MWVGTPIASTPIDSRWATIASQASALRLATAILAPATPNPSAIALPMPRVPPVMMATRPVRSWRVSSFSRSMVFLALVAPSWWWSRR